MAISGKTAGTAICFIALFIFATLILYLSVLETGRERLVQLQSTILQRLDQHHEHQRSDEECAILQDNVDFMRNAAQFHRNQLLLKEEQHLIAERLQNKDSDSYDSVERRFNDLEISVGSLDGELESQLQALHREISTFNPQSNKNHNDIHPLVPKIDNQSKKNITMITNQLQNASWSLEFRLHQQIAHTKHLEESLRGLVKSWNTLYEGLLEKTDELRADWSAECGRHYRPTLTPQLRERLKQEKEFDMFLDEASATATLPEPRHFQASSYPPIEERRQAVKNAFLHAWNGYKTHCWGWDELKPITMRCGNWSNPTSFGLTILDSLDTLYIMGLNDHLAEAKEWLKTVSFSSATSAISVFELSIRGLGGLLSMVDLTGEEIYIEKAKELGAMLYQAYDSAPGTPFIAPVTKIVPASPQTRRARMITNLAEAGSIQLEFLRYALLVQDKEIVARTFAIWELLDRQPKKFWGLYPLYVDNTGQLSTMAKISFGGMGDSFYEYLMKMNIYTQNRTPRYRKMYEAAIKGARQYLVHTTGLRNYTYLSELDARGRPTHTMEHLTCFSGGMIGLGASGESREKDLKLAEELTKTCYQFYNQMPTGIGAEVMQMNFLRNLHRPNDDFQALPRAAHYLLRPETLESIFVMYRVTGDSKYQDWAWEIFEAIEKFCKTEHGYSGLRNVEYVDSKKDDLQQSFFLAETLKYLYLIFSERSLIPLDQWVFNTEAHPLKVLNTDQLSDDWLVTIENPTAYLDSLRAATASPLPLSSEIPTVSSSSHTSSQPPSQHPFPTPSPPPADTEFPQNLQPRIPPPDQFSNEPRKSQPRGFRPQIPPKLNEN